MKVLDLLVGKKIMVETDMKVFVELEIKSIEEISHSVPLEPAIKANDWWPKSNDWTTYKVTFTNGATKEFSSINDINFF